MRMKKKYAINVIFKAGPFHKIIAWKCEICHALFDTFPELKGHKMVIHSH